MEIKKENVLAAYETARKAGADSTMKVLEQLFGEETFKPKDVTERIKTFEDACNELGENHPLVRAFDAWEREGYNNQKDVDAFFKLRIIVAALNEGWEPQFTESEWRYYPWFWLYTQAEINNMDEEECQDRRMMSAGDYQTDYAGFAFAHSDYVPSYSLANIGARLCLKSDTLARHCGKQFSDLWADFNLIRK